MEISISSFQAIALAVIVYYVGKYLKNKVHFFSEYCIPNPVIGGVLFAMLNLGSSRKWYSCHAYGYHLAKLFYDNVFY
jgi:sodium--glutamate symport carrier gltS